MKSSAFGRLILGPVGSGKTTSCIMELLRRSIEQSPAADGLRYTRFTVVRQTLRQLLDTVVKDCRQWLEEGGMGAWKISDKTFYLDFGDVRSEWVFIPLEDQADQARLLSMQLTAAWLSEAIEMDISVLQPLTGRIGRYPSGPRGTPTWSGIIGDTNFPTEMTPWQEFCEHPPPGWDIFKQPSGLSAEAENLNYLNQNEDTIKLPVDHPDRLARGRLYYQKMIDTWGDESDWIKRYVKAEYGNDPSGQAVFATTFRPEYHLVDETYCYSGFPLLVGQDFGRDPWSLICQMDHMGRLIVHREVPANNTGLERHVLTALRPALMSDKFMGYRVALVGDPAGVARDSHSEETSFDLLARLGLPAFPAPTNDIDPRLRAVEAFLTAWVAGHPAIMINRQGCPKLIRALAGGYRYKLNREGNKAPKPDKNDKDGYSHIVDCLEYVCLAAHGGMVGEIAKNLVPRPRPPGPTITAAGWT
jgi:hypothetical protein